MEEFLFSLGSFAMLVGLGALVKGLSQRRCPKRRQPSTAAGPSGASLRGAPVCRNVTKGKSY
jgi:hypothetical protein